MGTKKKDSLKDSFKDGAGIWDKIKDAGSKAAKAMFEHGSIAAMKKAQKAKK